MIRYRRLTKAAISLARHKEDRQEDTEQSVIKEILKNRRRASQETLKAGFSITTLKGNTIVKPIRTGARKKSPLFQARIRISKSPENVFR